VSKPKPKGKPFVVSKRVVWEASRKVKANRGAAGVDESPSSQRLSSEATRSTWGHRDVRGVAELLDVDRRRLGHVLSPLAASVATPPVDSLSARSRAASRLAASAVFALPPLPAVNV
jgi:hypothetical protein